jgi:hypothetical protein
VKKFNADDHRTVTVTVGTLKAFEAAVRARYEAGSARHDADRRLEAAKLEHDRASRAESDAIDAELAATRALHQTPEIT